MDFQREGTRGGTTIEAPDVSKLEGADLETNEQADTKVQACPVELHIKGAASFTQQTIVVENQVADVTHREAELRAGLMRRKLTKADNP